MEEHCNNAKTCIETNKITNKWWKLQLWNKANIIKKEEGHWPTCRYNQNIKINGQQMVHNKNARKQANCKV
jgi:hypothetical protein